jgi:hypothetical protein
MTFDRRVIRLEDHLRRAPEPPQPPLDSRVWVWVTLIAFHVMGGLAEGEEDLLETYKRVLLTWPVAEREARTEAASRALLAGLGPDYFGEPTPAAIAEAQRLLDAVPVELRYRWPTSAREMWDDDA